MHQERRITHHGGPLELHHKIGHCNIALLKDSFKNPKDAIKSHKFRDLEKLTLKFKNPKSWAYLKETESVPAPWQIALKSQVVEKIEVESVINKSALMFFQIKNRIFVAMFGRSANSFLESGAIEHDFGFTVVNRVVDPNSINHVETNSYEANSVKAKMQLAQGASMDRYSLNRYRTDVKAISGKSKDTKYGKRLHGSKSLVVHQSMTFTEMFQTCEHWLDVYEGNPDSFEPIWQNFGTTVTDPMLITTLNQKLLVDLKAGEVENIFVGTPEQYDPVVVEGFKFSSFENELTTELSINTLLDNLDEKDFSYELFQKLSIQEKLTESGQLINKWSVWECIEFEIQINEVMYCLQQGIWKSYPKSIVTDVNNFVDSLGLSHCVLPPAFINETEGDYSLRINRDMGLVHMDKALIRGPGFTSGIELCDLIHDITNELIHLKRGTRSSELSHLFRQGVNSLKMIILEKAFRDQAVRELSKKMNSKKAASFFDRGELTITFGIITSKKEKKWSKILPFFSQLSLLDGVRELKLMRARVCLIQISQVKGAKKTLVKPLLEAEMA
ncbi:MAG: TIGR04141 family sporadically distributed protein [Bdellovibrionaceae bacterium]|nr:TIGR04141 family sporadically distributed protein [Pseudobdellovibrionaceae bacterium]